MDAALLSEKVGEEFMLAYLVDTLGMFKGRASLPAGEAVPAGRR